MYAQEVNYFGKSFRPAIIRIRLELGVGLVGAEIGVNKGENSVSIANLIQPKRLFLIDRWDNFLDHDSGEIIGEAQYQTVKNTFKDKETVIVMRAPSEQAVKTFEDNYFDFVYIDAGHEYEYVKKDIYLWYPKVKKGGFFCGHDYDLTCGNGGVVRAVKEFSRDSGNFVLVESQDWCIRK